MYDVCETFKSSVKSLKMVKKTKITKFKNSGSSAKQILSPHEPWRSESLQIHVCPLATIGVFNIPPVALDPRALQRS